MIRRIGGVVLVVLLALAAGFALLPRPAAPARPGTARYAVVVGVAGLRWSDVTRADMPALWRLAAHGAIGSLSTRAARSPTCPADGWLTLGAGNYGDRLDQPADGVCRPLSVDVARRTGGGGYLADQGRVVARNRANPWGAAPGALAEAVRCSTAVGPGAAVALARPAGRVDRYLDAVPSDLGAVLDQCVLSAVDAGTVAGTGADRRADARRADAIVAKVLAGRPADSLVLVVGLSDTVAPARLHVAVADGPGFTGGWLTSPSTRRPGYLQLVDVAPTVLTALDRPRAPKLFVGQRAQRVGGRPADLGDAVRLLDSAARQALAQARVSAWFFLVLTIVQIALLLGMVPVLRWLGRLRSGHPAREVPGWLVPSCEAALMAVSLVLPAALVTDLLPWWRSETPVRWCVAAVLGIVAVLTTVLWYSPLGRRPLGPLAFVAAVSVLIVGVDTVTGSHLQLNGLAGYAASYGIRFAGLGTVGFGVFAAGVLLGAALLAQTVGGRRRRAAVVAGTGAAAVVVVGSPLLGADAGGAIALAAGVWVAAALATGGWLTFGRLAGALLVAVGVTAAFAAADLAGPADARGNLGRFLSRADEGTAILHRLGQTNVIAFATSPLTVLAVFAGLYAYVVMPRSWGGLRRVVGLHPALRGALLGLAVATVLGSVADGSGLAAAGAAAATVVPVTVLAALRLAGRADERTGAGPAPARPPATGRPPIVDHPAEPAPDAGLGAVVPGGAERDREPPAGQVGSTRLP